MQDIYTYVPKTNHVSRVYSIAAILQLLFIAHIMLFTLLNLLYFYISTVRNMFAVPNMAVFCSSLILCFSSILLGYFLNDFEMVSDLFLHSTCAAFLL